MKYHIYRTHLSSYWPKNFLDLEQSSLNQLSNCIYHGLEKDSSHWQQPAILLSNTQFNPELVPNHHWKNVKLILHANSGYDNLLTKDFFKQYVGPILIAPKLRAQAVAEYNIQAWLSGLGRIPFQTNWDKQRLFPRKLAQSEMVLIIGFGHVGKKTYQLIKATEAKVDIYDPYVEQEQDFISKINWEKYSSIIFCCSLTKSAQSLLSSNTWKSLSPEVILINSARGALFNLEELSKFAINNPKSKFYLDVFENEPFHGLTNDSKKLPDNVFTSSHIAGVYDQLLHATNQWHHDTLKDFTTMNLEHFLSLRKNENLRLRRTDL